MKENPEITLQHSDPLDFEAIGSGLRVALQARPFTVVRDIWNPIGAEVFYTIGLSKMGYFDIMLANLEESAAGTLLDQLGSISMRGLFPDEEEPKFHINGLGMTRPAFLEAVPSQQAQALTTYHSATFPGKPISLLYCSFADESGFPIDHPMCNKHHVAQQRYQRLLGSMH